MSQFIHRRKVLKGAITLPFLGSILLACNAENIDNDKKENTSLNILILGGTSFLGPHQIAYAVDRGHKITTFTRGKTKPSIHQEVFEQVTMLIGDREDNLEALKEGEWDIVIDNSGRKVDWTKRTAELLKDRVGHYMYTSSTGVYYPYLGEDIKEDTKLVLEVPSELDDEYETLEYDYGVMKSNSEIAVKDIFGKDRAILVRPTYMFGPGDKTDRFIYWPIRLSRGGEVLVPGGEEDPVQYVDVRDVAEFMIRLGEEKAAGTYNAVGPSAPETMREFVSKASQAFEAENTFVFIDDLKFLSENGVSYLVPWIPPIASNYGSARVSNQKAIAAGLSFRSLSSSMQETLEWWNSDAVAKEKREAFETNPKALLMRESAIIQKWKAI